MNAAQRREVDREVQRQCRLAGMNTNSAQTANELDPKAKPSKEHQTHNTGVGSRVKTCYKWWSIVWGIFGPIITIFGICYSLSPNVDVTNLLPTDPSAPFSAPFEINNLSTFAIHDVKVSCQTELSSGRTVQLGGSSANPGAPFATIAPRETATVACAHGQNFAAAFVPFEGFIYFHIRFHYAWWPFVITRHYAFWAYNARDQHGWVKEPVDNLRFRNEPEILPTR
jgi:hypothetical protein